jgi:hypothetical protein
VSWAAPVAIGLLLAAGLPRLVWGSPAQRALATAMCSAAVVLVLELDVVRRPLLERGLVPLGALLQCLAITLGAAAAYAMARQVAPEPGRRALSPAAVGVPVALLQCLLFAASGVGAGPSAGALFSDHLDRPAVVVLWLVTAAAAAAAGAVLLPLLRRYGPGLALRRSRFAAGATFVGAVLVGVAGLAMGARLALLVTGQPDAAALVAVAVPLAPLGLAVVAVGVLGVRAATALDPVLRWGRAHLALHRLGGLAGELAAAAPEWGVSSVDDRWSARNPADQLYRRVIAVRDASWTLLGSLDDDAPLERAAEFAAARTGGGRPAAALAEACWLRAAVRERARAGRPSGPRATQFPQRTPEPPGSVDDEAAFLVAVARAWRSPLTAEFLAGSGDDRHSALSAG